MTSGKRKEKYIGSVRFFKHVILSTVALSVIVPVCASCVLLYFNLRTNKAYEKTKKELKVYAEELAEISQQLEEAQMSLEAKAEAAQSLIKNSSVSNWKLVLVNEEHPLTQGYAVKLEDISEGVQVDARIVDELNAMLEAMRNEGMDPVVLDGYRNFETQDNVFEEYVAKKVADGFTYEEAFYTAKARYALPGNSEHHTGLAVDVVGSEHQTLDDEQASTKEAQWLAENCAKYGFILRFPMEKTAITGQEYQSWHFRYVGKEVASYIMENEITLEEFIVNLNN